MIEMDSRTQKTFRFVFLTLFVDLTAFTLILPLLPKILEYYATNDESNAYKLYNENVKNLQLILGVPESHNQVLLAGVLGSWFSLLQFISSPFIGALSDKFGRKSVMLMTMSGSVVSYATWLISGKNFGLFVLSRTIGGLSKANVGLSLAIVSDVSDETSRGKGMALVGASFSLAFIIGPLLGAFLSTLTGSGQEQQLQRQLIINPAMIALSLSIVGFALAVLLLDETNNEKSKLKKGATNSSETYQVESRNPLARAIHYVNPRSLFKFNLINEQNPSRETQILKRTGLIYFLYLLFYSGLEFTLSFLTHIRFGFTSMEQGKLYLFSGIIMTLIQGGYIRRIRSGREPLIALIGLTLIVPAFVWMGLSTKPVHIYQSLTMYAISSAIVVPCLTTVISSYSPVESRGLVMGTFRSLGALARAVGPVLASIIFWTFGPTTCYIGGAIALLIPHYIMCKTYKNMQIIPSHLKPTDKKTQVEQKFAKAN